MGARKFKARKIEVTKISAARNLMVRQAFKIEHCIN